MQAKYFTLWVGDWETAIDWTGTVINTHLTAALSTFSKSLEYIFPSTSSGGSSPSGEAQELENVINKYFTQGIGYYYVEDILSIRNEAYDDMQWVVLDWLEGIRFIDAHSKAHYPLSSNPKNANGTDWWYARQFIPPFAHRSRVFYELAEQGWDETLCGGGMLWSPVGLPYKNTVTNELFISASINMYLYFPGDNIDSPFVLSSTHQQPQPKPNLNPSAEPTHDPKYLAAAIKAYNWLANINMTNDQGLYVDGYHISGLDKQRHSRNTICDERDETVWTYNQGILLSGLRGLWDATGNATYLSDAHTLVQNVIRATGWTSSSSSSSSSSTNTPTNTTTNLQHKPEQQKQQPNANTLGTNGILTERCDPTGDCTQDAQTFKSIFFHHFTSFCAPLTPTTPFILSTPVEIASSHALNCTRYLAWVEVNAQAALATRDQEGRFGAWWGARWDGGTTGEGDPNERGRGRTVESQGGGVAALRAWWELGGWYGGGGV
ncbi:glycoside hydrolase family 76 protein [Periconia macrospinosa]|uniref:Glycoside hydrolase family 76 protein n=1 Tax=Periconia macrospinosa TaxID=97972 RepID=A0A2V1D9L7_9PLEO|nr:glycoside hydrolase family 76 protein [Periconia macrospinosa]